MAGNGNGIATLTELEITKLENFALKHAGLQQAIQNNLAARTKYIEKIEAERPGYFFSEQTGQLVLRDQPAPPAIAEA
jgi:hypothetical protein